MVYWHLELNRGFKKKQYTYESVHVREQNEPVFQKIGTRIAPFENKSLALLVWHCGSGKLKQVTVI